MDVEEPISPCPFCGATAQLYISEAAFMVSIECLDCPALMYESLRTTWRKEAANLVRVWNRRPTDFIPVPAISQ